MSIVKERNPNLSLCFGVGIGKTSIIHFGGVLDNIQVFLTGEALAQAMQALRIASEDVVQEEKKVNVNQENPAEANVKSHKISEPVVVSK